MILMIDNYDSFTYNLVQLFQKIGQEIVVRQNNQITVDEIRQLDPRGIILSPGPCTPLEAGICIDIVKNLAAEYPILGVCLGHQVIGHVYGAVVGQAPHIIHGKTDTIVHEEDVLFDNIPDTFTATRYHSLVVTNIEKSTELVATAYSKSDQVLMALRHKIYPVFGVQFHPESYASEYGLEIAKNFVFQLK